MSTPSTFPDTLVSHQFRMVGQATVTTGILWEKWFFWFDFLHTTFFNSVFHFGRLVVLASLWASARPAMVPVAPLALKSYQQRGSVKINTQTISLQKTQWIILPVVFYYSVQFFYVSVQDGPAPLHFLPLPSVFQTRPAEQGAPLVSFWGFQLPLSWVFMSWKSEKDHQN